MLFLHDCIECFDSHMLFLCCRVLLTFYSVIYSMLLFGLGPPKCNKPQFSSLVMNDLSVHIANNRLLDY